MASGGALGRLSVVLGLDSVEFTRGLNKSEYQAKQSLDSIAKNAKTAATAIAGLSVAVGAVAFATFVRETMQAEKEQAQLAAVLASTGQAAGYSRQQLNDMASAMSLVSTVSAGEINEAQTTLLAFTGIAGEQFPKALQAAIDMAARTGMSVVQASETIGRALDIPSQGLTSLSKQGFRFTDDQKKLAERLEATGKTAEAQGIILGALEESYGGAAKAARDTFGGSITGLKNQLNELMTGQDGSLDGAKEAVNSLSDTLGSAETKKAFADFVAMIAGATNAFANFMTTINEGSFWGWVQTSGADAKNAEAEIGKLEARLVSLRKTRENLDPDKSFANKINDIMYGDVGDIDRQIASIEEKLKALRVIARQNQRDVEREFGYLGLAATGLPGVPGKPAGGGKSDKAKKEERNYVASNLDEMLIRMGEATEWLDSYEIKAEKTFDKTGEFALEAARNIQKSLGDGLYDILSGNFDDIGQKFGDTLIRMVAEAQAAQLAKAMFGDYDKSGKMGGFLGDIIGSIWPSGALSGVTASPSLDLNSQIGSWGSFTPVAFSGGGFTGPGGKYEPAGIVHKGEYVLNQGATQRMGVATLDRINKGYANGGLVGGSGLGAAGTAPNVKLNVINQGDPMQAQQKGGPRFDGEAWVIDVVLKKARLNGAFRDQMRSALAT